ncbi:MAG: UvrD-helicase domain-containing protein [Luteimonas sp.]
MAKFPPTDEQAAICQAGGHVVKANAFAGTGKSSTFVFLAESRPTERILYVAFNKAIQTEAEARFPQNVKARTGHSLAYRSNGFVYGSVPKKLAGDIRPYHINAMLLASGLSRMIPAASQNLYSGRVIETLKNYLVSADMEFNLGHASIGSSPAERQHFDGNAVLAGARMVWGWMQDAASSVPMLHDGYLKQYQLTNPRLPYDRILFDEAQDTNPVMQAIVASQACPIAYVGDRHQGIYGFRGASNAMQTIKANQEFGLTGSFRFGPAIADVANRLLRLKREPLQIKGLGHNTQVGMFDHRTHGHAFITRGNSALFHEAVHALSLRRPFAFVGDIRGYRFDQIVDAYNLYAGEPVKDCFIASFASFDEFAEYGESMGDREVKARVRLVTTYAEQIPRLVDQIHANALPYVKDSDEQAAHNVLVLATAHKSKGLEFDNVRLSDDYMSLWDDDGNLFDIADASQEDIEELNLQYVAATRARKRMELSEQLQLYVDWSKAMDSKPSVQASPMACAR